MKRGSLSLVALLALVVTGLCIAISCTPTGTTQKDCVVWLGDSIFALSGDEATSLEKLSSQSYRTYYVVGAQMDGGSVKTVPQQYTQAKNADKNIRTVIFDGGGNDVIIGERTACSTSYPNGKIGQACYDMIDKVEAINIKFWEQMIADGVQNLVQQGYYYAKDQNFWVCAEIFQARTISEWNKVAAKHPNVKMVFADPTTVFNKNQAASYTKADGIHPTAAASETLANLLWNSMKSNDIEQTNSCSGSSSSSSSSSGGCN